jgi:hypothetical protein
LRPARDGARALAAAQGTDGGVGSCSGGC